MLLSPAWGFPLTVTYPLCPSGVMRIAWGAPPVGIFAMIFCVQRVCPSRLHAIPRTTKAGQGQAGQSGHHPVGHAGGDLSALHLPAVSGGLRARVLDGEVARLAGNPFHPINRGSLCPKAFGRLQLLYVPIA